MEAAASPQTRRKRVRATEEASLTTPKGSVVKFQVDNGAKGGDVSKDEHKARLAFNRQSKCRALQEHNKDKDKQAKADQVQRQHLRCPTPPALVCD